MIPNRTARPHVNAEYVQQSRIDPTPKTCPRFFQKSLQGPRSHRAISRQAQTIQTHRTTLREDSSKLQFLRGSRTRLHLDQIHLHGLVRTVTESVDRGMAVALTELCSLFVPVVNMVRSVLLTYVIP